MTALLTTFALIIMLAAEPLPAALQPFADAWSKIDAYRAVLTVHETSGGQVQDRTYNYTFAKPHSATIAITGGPGRGGFERWDGSDTVTASPAGLLSFVKLRVSIHDPRVVTLRGDTVDMASFAWLLQHFATQGRLSTVSGPVIEHVPTVQVTDDVANPAENGGITRDVIDISTTTFLPVRALRYDGAALVKQIDISNVQTTPPSR